MERSEKESELRALIKELTKVDITALSRQEDLVDTLGLDSLSALRLLALVEKKFAVRFPDEELTRLRTLDALVNAIVADASGSQS